MKVTLNKKIQLHTAQVYLRFQKEVERKDIQDYLNGKHFNNPLVENRVRDYLKNIGVFDEQYQLTRLGHSVRETGKLPTAEEGKYHIAYTQGDSFFGNKIFFFKRVQPNKREINKREIQQLSLQLDRDGHFLLPTSENPYTKLNLQTRNDFVGQKTNQTDMLEFTWIWENLEKSHYIFTGQLGKQETKIKDDAIPSNEKIYDKITEILPEWDTKNQRFKIRFGETTEQYRRTFENNNYQTRWNNFNVNINNVPLMPYDTKEAIDWRNWLITEELKKEYFSPPDFEDKMISIGEKEAFTPYPNNLKTVVAKNFVKGITKETTAFWHLSAPMDLNPNTKVKPSAKSATPVEIKEGDKISFAEIAERMGFDNAENAIFLYYDKYVVEYRQQKAVFAMANAFDCKNKIVITLPLSEMKSEFSKNCPDIKPREMKTIFTTGYPPHDRCIVFGNKENLKVWNVPNSIDFIKFSDLKNLDKNSVGAIRQSIVFTPISKEMLKPELLNFINNEINGK